MTPLLATQVRIAVAAHMVAARLADRLDEVAGGDRGEVSSTTILVGVFCAMAIAVGAILYNKFTAKANSIPTGP
ncbi:MAG TPA: hypothetical protein VHA73_05395 [Acidimicrobiales bacterium]|nr:hypothetical protein [Acidimicrobiales bacterium]